MKNKRLWLLYPWLIWPALSNAIDEQHVRVKAHTVYGLYLSPYEAFNMKKQQGDRKVYGWKNSRLPWGYQLNKNAMDFNFDSTRRQESD